MHAPHTAESPTLPHSFFAFMRQAIKLRLEDNMTSCGLRRQDNEMVPKLFTQAESAEQITINLKVFSALIGIFENVTVQPKKQSEP